MLTEVKTAAIEQSNKLSNYYCKGQEYKILKIYNKEIKDEISILKNNGKIIYTNEVTLVLVNIK